MIGVADKYVFRKFSRKGACPAVCSPFKTRVFRCENDEKTMLPVLNHRILHNKKDWDVPYFKIIFIGQAVRTD